MMKLLRKMLLALVLAGLMLVANAAVGNIDAAVWALAVLAVLLVLATYWLWRGQR